jgi:hypothetical protein
MKNRLILLFIITVLAACNPGGPEDYEDFDAIYTVYEQQYDFDVKSTFAMPDAIVVDVQIENGDTIYEFMSPLYASPILQSIQRNMEANGWTRVSVAENPDLLLTPAGISSTTYFYSYWYDWWYGGYWGWYGWYYPPYYTVSSYTTGSLVMILSDPNLAEQSPINRGPALWIGVANGLLVGNYNINRVTNGIDQAFLQSPYLKTN